MTDTLLYIAISLLGALIIISIVLIFLFLRRKSAVSGGLSSEDLQKLLQESRMNSYKDYASIIKSQNEEINKLKDGITSGMNEAQKNNQNDLYKFLDETKKRLSDIQLNFNKESADVKQQNLSSIKDLISQTTKDISELKTKIVAEINDANIKNNKNVNEQNVKTQEQINSQIQTLKEQVQKSLEAGFEKNDKAMQDFIQKTALIEASTRQIEDLRKEISRFNNILSNQKTRGNFGEDVLDQILTAIFGDVGSSTFYRKQVDLTKEFKVGQVKDEKGEKQNVIVDFLFNVITDHGVLPLSIDAKFPYANYLPLLDETISPELREETKKKFKADVKGRIKEVTKYIVDGKTAPYAVMFIPAEAVFIDIFKEFPDVVEEARKQKIIIASPSLIVTIIQILQFILKDYQLRNNADQILRLIDEIGSEFGRFASRWEDHKKHVEALGKDVKDIDTTTVKMVKRFDEAKNYIDHNKISEPKAIVFDGDEIIDVDDER
ncbi:MAG: DNA recombination protein RmuC [Bacilli bacterium]|jgi:DNA recombination protein RmuC